MSDSEMNYTRAIALRALSHFNSLDKMIMLMQQDDFGSRFLSTYREDTVTGEDRFIDFVLLANGAPPPIPSEPEHEKINQIGFELGFNETEMKIFHYAYEADSNPGLKAFLDESRDQRADKAWAYPEIVSLMAYVLDAPPDDMRKALLPDSELRKTGVLDDLPSFHKPKFTDFLELSRSYLEYLWQPVSQQSPILSLYVYQDAASELTLKDYPHIAPQLRYLIRLIRTGANTQILLNGPPGVGKSELATVIARECNLEFYKLSFNSVNGSALSAESRMTNYLAGQKVLGNRGTSGIFIADECEDMFAAEKGYTRALNKPAINELLEKPEFPTIWITNGTESFDPAFISRMHEVKVDQLPVRQKKKLIKRYGSLNLSKKFVDRLVSFDNLETRKLTSVLSSATRLALSGEKAEKMIADLALPALKKKKPRLRPRARTPSSIRFEQRWINTESLVDDLPSIVQTRDGISMIFEGPPGTGKTAFASQLAKQSNRPFHVFRLTDVLGPFVGQNEENIKNIFEKIQETGGFGLIDEFDSLAPERSRTDSDWRTSMVNEFLPMLDEFQRGPGMLAVTTNFIESIDSAVLSRFDFKVKFGFLREHDILDVLERICRRNGITVTSRRFDELLKYSTINNFSLREMTKLDRRLQLSSGRAGYRELLTLLEERLDEFEKIQCKHQTRGFSVH